MKENLLLLLFLGSGVALGASGQAPAVFHEPWLPMAVLSLLIVQVGIGLGAKLDVRAMVRSFRWPMLLLPLFTVAGSLLFSALALLFFPDGSLSDMLAVGSGFGYYSLSSVLIVETKTLTAGAAAATQLGAVALLANVLRELLALFGCSFFARRGGRFAAISVAGINSMDVCLPSILRTTGDRSLLPVAVFHGLVLEVSVPLLVTLFCS